MTFIPNLTLMVQLHYDSFQIRKHQNSFMIGVSNHAQYVCQEFKQLSLMLLKDDLNQVHLKVNLLKNLKILNVLLHNLTQNFCDSAHLV